MDIFDNKGKGKATESGFDAVQLRPHEKATWIPAPPPFKPENPEMTEKQLDDDSDDDFTVRSVSPLSR